MARRRPTNHMALRPVLRSLRPDHGAISSPAARLPRVRTCRRANGIADIFAATNGETVVSGEREKEKPDRHVITKLAEVERHMSWLRGVIYCLPEHDNDDLLEWLREYIEILEQNCAN